MIVECIDPLKNDFYLAVVYATGAAYSDMHRSGSYFRLVDARTFANGSKEAKNMPPDAASVLVYSTSDGQKWISGAVYISGDDGNRHMVAANASGRLTGSIVEMWDGVRRSTYDGHWRDNAGGVLVGMADNKTVKADFHMLSDSSLASFFSEIVGDIPYCAEWRRDIIGDSNESVVMSTPSIPAKQPPVNKDIHFVIHMTQYDVEDGDWWAPYAVCPYYTIHTESTRTMIPLNIDGLDAGKKGAIVDSLVRLKGRQRIGSGDYARHRFGIEEVVINADRLGILNEAAEIDAADRKMYKGRDFNPSGVWKEKKRLLMNLAP